MTGEGRAKYGDYLAPIKELYDDKHVKRENGSSVVLFSGEYGSSIWGVR